MNTIPTPQPYPEVTVLNRRAFSGDYWNESFENGEAFSDHITVATLTAAEHFGHTQIELSLNAPTTGDGQSTIHTPGGTSLLDDENQIVRLHGGQRVQVTHWGRRGDGDGDILPVRSINGTPLATLECYDFTDALCDYVFTHKGEDCPTELQAARFAIRASAKKAEVEKEALRTQYRREKLLGGLIAKDLIPRVSILLGVRPVQA